MIRMTRECKTVGDMAPTVLLHYFMRLRSTYWRMPPLR